MTEQPPLPVRPRFRRVYILLGLVAGLGALALGLVSACRGPGPGPGPDTNSEEVEKPGPAPFEDVTASSGIAFTYRNGEEAGNFAIIESLGGGVALIDYDGDGLLDVFIPGGGYYKGSEVLGNPCKLYRNLGNFKFEDVTAKVGLDKINFQYSHGAAAFDYDCDGWPDLLVTGYNRLVLLHNVSDGQGGRKFVDATKQAGLNDTLWSSAAAWGDLDGDGYPEIYVSHYGDWGFATNHPTNCTYDGKTRDVCQPAKFKPLPHTLYKNNRDGTFTDVSEQVKLRKDGKGMDPMLVDINNDGRPDIYVANDTDAKYLYVNVGKRGELALQEVALMAGVAMDERGVANGSMGLAAADFNRTGRASLFVTNYENELPALYRNNSGSSVQFTYDTLRSGVSAIGGLYVGWGVGFLDFDLDGWDDLFFVNGHAIRFPTKIDRRQKPVFLWSNRGTFKQPVTKDWPYFSQPHNARGVAFGDLDNDGKIDAVISHLNEPVVVLRNVYPTAGRHWLGVRLVRENGADIVGSRVVLESAGGKQTKFAVGGGSFASTSDPRLVFGLGPDTKISKVTVHWPSGKAQEVAGLEPDAYWQITEGDPTPKRTEQKKDEPKTGGTDKNDSKPDGPTKSHIKPDEPKKP
jgi:enediyne biosynthesis protein E4